MYHKHPVSGVAIPSTRTDKDAAKISQQGMSTEPTPSTPASEQALQAIAAVLDPLARLMIEHAVDLSSVVEELKSALVRQAGARYALDGRGASDARVALLTGVHRKDVRRLRNLPGSSAPQKPGISVASAVVARWISDAQYLHFDQKPLRLARSPRFAEPSQPDFSALVASVSTDTSARTVLDELLRLGVVGIEDETHVTLLRTSFVPQQDAAGKFHFLASAISDHLSAAVSNLGHSDTSKPMLDQSAFSEDLDAKQAALLHDKARALWTQALQKFLVDAAVAEQRSEVKTGERYRVRFGTYFLEEAQAPKASSTHTKPKRSRVKTRVADK